MTLDMELKVPEYETTLKYHSTRPPDELSLRSFVSRLI